MHRTRRADCRWTTHIMLARNFAFLNIDDFHLYRNSSRHVCRTTVQPLKAEVASRTSRHPAEKTDQVEWGAKFEKEGKLSPQTSTRKCTPPNQKPPQGLDDSTLSFMWWKRLFPPMTHLIRYCFIVIAFVNLGRREFFFANLHCHLKCFCKGWQVFGSHKSNVTVQWKNEKNAHLLRVLECPSCFITVQYTP